MLATRLALKCSVRAPSPRQAAMKSAGTCCARRGGLQVPRMPASPHSGLSGGPTSHRNRRLLCCRKHVNTEIARRSSSGVDSARLRGDAQTDGKETLAPGRLTPGVAGVGGLHSPGDFAPLARAAVMESNRLREAIRSGKKILPLAILRAVDAISNTICSVIDAGDFIRNAHADERFRDAADEAFSLLAEYIQELNADDCLYHALCRVAADREAMEGFTEEQRRVVKLHMAEFERGGIHLSGNDRAEVVALQNEATKLERLFEYNIVAKRAAFQVDRKDLQGVPDFLLARIPQPDRQPSDRFTLLTDQSVMADVLKNARSGSLRRAMYLAGNSVAAENVEVLERLMLVRHKLAQKVGFESHAHRATSDKMAETPQEVLRFLDALSDGVREKAEREADMLRKAKMELEGTSELFAWDISYYMGYIKSRECNLDGKSLSEYFTLGGCLGGLRMVCSGLFGISLEQVSLHKKSKDVRLRKVPIESGENWAAGEAGAGSDGGVRKLILRHDVEGVLGTIYLDLHRREGKFGHAAHFTVRCGCAITQEDADAGGGAVVEYQLPTVVLVCNFSLPEPPRHRARAKHQAVGVAGDSVKRKPPSTSFWPADESAPLRFETPLQDEEHLDDSRLMSHSEVETLFHEFGHALHSLLSRTELQHVSGTRVPVDFCEIPSHLMEHFAWDRNVLTKFARHHRTGESPPGALLDRLHKSKTLFAGMAIQTQLLYATFDQRLFGPQPDGGVWSSTSIADALQEQIAGIPRCKGALWHSRFGHFTGYGASYYAYLYAKMFTSGIWERHFAADPLNRDAGELLWKELFIHGGAKDPHEILEALLGEGGRRGEAGVRSGVASLLKDMDVV